MTIARAGFRVKGFKVGGAFKSLAVIFAVLAIAATFTVYAAGVFDTRPFGAPLFYEESGAFSPEKHIAPLKKVSGVQNGEIFTDKRGAEAAPLKNNVKPAPPISQMLQIARFAMPSGTLETDGGNFVYYCQAWAEYASLPYGNETIGSYGCGPANIAMVVSTLTARRVTPAELADCAEKWGFFVPGVGTAHGIFAKSAATYHLKLEEFDGDAPSILERLRAGKLIICSMGKGYFSRSGHFITLRGIDAEGKILIADSLSETNTDKAFDLDFLVSQLRYSHMWAFGE